MSTYAADPILVLIAGLGLASAYAFQRATRGIEYFSTDTDNARQAFAASHSDEWRWPSDLHRYGGGKTFMKDVTVLMLSVFQRLLRDRKSDHPLVTMCGFSNALAAVLLYWVGRGYWGTAVGAWISILYLGSVWIWQIALMGGHILPANLSFLASMAFVQASAHSSPWGSAALHAAAGATFCTMLYSSASGRKYIPFFLAALIYARFHEPLDRGDFGTPLHWIHNSMLQSRLELGLFIAAVAVLVILLWIRLSYRQLITFLYQHDLSIIRGMQAQLRSRHELSHYLSSATAELSFRSYLSKFISLDVQLLLLTATTGAASTLALCGGFLLVYFTLSFPDTVQNTIQYFQYSTLAFSAGHFRLYEKYFEKIGKPIPADMRGAGMPWLFAFFFRISPWIAALFLIAAPAVLIEAALHRTSCSVATAVVALALAISPIAWGEITRGPQLGRSYLPGLLGILYFLAFSARQLGPLLPHLDTMLSLYTLAALVWNVTILVRDVYPARMASTWLLRALRELKIERFSTYTTPFNHGLIENISQESRAPFQIDRIQSLSQVRSGYVVVPPISGKSLIMESERVAIEKGDFTDDPELTRLIESREISKMAARRFHTFGTSRIWLHESEVCSYRDLILKEISDEDRWKGFAWLIEIKENGR